MSVENVYAAVEVLRGRRVSFDLDGAVVNSPEHVTDLFNGAHQTNYIFAETTDYLAIVEWFRKLGVTDPYADAVEFYNRNEVFLGSPPIRGAIPLVRFLRRRGAEMYFITSRPARVKEGTLAWFQKWLPEIPMERVVMSSEETINTDFKIEQIGHLGIDYHFEDNFEHALKIVEATKATVGLVKQPYNGHYQKNDRIIYCPDKAATSNIMYTFAALAKHITEAAE